MSKGKKTNGGWKRSVRPFTCAVWSVGAAATADGVGVAFGVGLGLGLGEGLGEGDGVGEGDGFACSVNEAHTFAGWVRQMPWPPTGSSGTWTCVVKFPEASALPDPSTRLWLLSQITLNAWFGGSCVPVTVTVLPGGPAGGLRLITGVKVGLGDGEGDAVGDGESAATSANQSAASGSAARNFMEPAEC
jgi:hypothetical protein